MSITPRRAAVATVLLTCLALLGACGVLERPAEPEPAITPAASAAPAFDSQFTRDGTFQSHVKIKGVDFVYTIWPTKSTPRTNEWYPGGDKFFSFTFQAYDLNRKFRDPFKTKRRAWLGQISVSSETTTASGNTEQPYSLDAEASEITFDPQPVDSRYGMLVTSPKGAFELRNQKIGTLAPDTTGVTLTFEATVWVETRARSKKYEPEVIRQEVPIAIFASDEPTKAQKIPINAN